MEIKQSSSTSRRRWRKWPLAVVCLLALGFLAYGTLAVLVRYLTLD